MITAAADTVAAPSSLEAIRALVGAIPDPEIPVISLAELGILRSVAWEDDRPVVTLTPTYSGCPATEAITEQVRAVLIDAGHPGAQVRIELAPAWSTDWISDSGRRKLRNYGIAPPHQTRARAEEAAGKEAGGKEAGDADPDHSVHPALSGAVRVLRFQPGRAADQPGCPRCDSPIVELLSAYGSTPCKSLYRCRSCGEPFDYFKPY